MAYRIARFLCFAALLTGASAGSALITELPAARTAPTLDGRVRPEEIGGAAQVKLSVLGGVDRPKHPTTAYLALTTSALYIGFICEDGDPAGLVCRAADDGPVFLDDSVQLFISPDAEPSRTNYFHFAVNPSGARYSCRLSDDQALRGWQSATSRTEKGWESEMLIPLDLIGASVRARYWRANVARERPARGSDPTETTAWVNPGMSLHNYRRFGFLQLAGPSRPVSAVAGNTTVPADQLKHPPVAQVAGGR